MDCRLTCVAISLLFPAAGDVPAQAASSQRVTTSANAVHDAFIDTGSTPRGKLERYMKVMSLRDAFGEAAFRASNSEDLERGQ